MVSSSLILIVATFSLCLCFNGVPANIPPHYAAGGNLKIILAINAGGNAHKDIYGIVYMKDPSDQGVASDFGLRLNIDRAHPEDQILYQTERYSHSSFGYDIPIKEDGNYVLVLKFSEVYFRASNAKVFNVILNSQHSVVEDLDIFRYVGYAAAHDEIVPFIVTDHAKKLIVGTTSSPIRGNRIRLDFVKGAADNPKVNAFYVAKGSVEHIPQLPPPQGYDEEGYAPEGSEEDGLFYGDEDEEIQFSRADLGFEGTKLPVYKGNRIVGSKLDIRSGPVSDDPWDFESPVVIYTPLVATIVASTASFWFLRTVMS